MKNVASCFLGLTLLTPAIPSLADAIPYPNTHQIAPEVRTYAAGNSGVNIYFYAPSFALYTDFVEVYDLQTGYDSGAILNNHTTAAGAEITVGGTAGEINAGDQLIFYMDSPGGKFASISSYSADGVNHAYITPYSGGVVSGVTIPAGLYVGMEDAPNGASDFNYLDDTFVFTNISAPSTSVTPEPGSLVLLATGALGMVGLLGRRHFAACL